MKLYAIVDKFELEPGYYKLTNGFKENEKEIIVEPLRKSLIVDLLFKPPLVTLTGAALGLYGNNSKSQNNPIKEPKLEKTAPKRDAIVINIDHFINVMLIEKIPLLSKLFDNANQCNEIFSNCKQLINFKRNFLPETIGHYGGENGIFDYGLYCEHPKNENILLPLKNYPELIKTLILEETIQAFEMLGAKSIVIEDQTNLSVDASAKAKKYGEASVSYNQEKDVLRSKKFGKRKMDPAVNWENIYFLSDYPNIMSIIRGRENGNQLYEKFKETININANLKIDVMKIFGMDSNFNYNRKWMFEVEFYDKNEL